MLTSSLRVRLLWWLILPMTAFVLIAGAASWQNARSTASIVQDNGLLASVRIIGEDIDWDSGSIVVQIPPAALELFESPERDSVFYRIEDGRKRLLAGNANLPLPASFSAAPTFYSTYLDDGRRVRAVVYVRQMFDAGRTENVTVAVGKTELSRDVMVVRLSRPQFVLLILLLVLAMLLVYFGLTFELRPLMKLKDDVADRTPSELQPIRPEWLHTELKPIVDAINQCISRMSLQAATQRQFISDAAHQLRTPLTLLDAQIQFARLCKNASPPLADALAGMHRSSHRMAALTNKLLLLAQAESAAFDSFHARVDLTAAVAGVLEELVVFAQQRDIDLGADIRDELSVVGDNELTTALLTNLVDNALRYTQRGGRVTVIVSRGNDKAIVQVADNGPGLSPEAYAHVFERFYRASHDTDGSGLGLPIVKEIARRQGGAISLSAPPHGRGLVATVEMRLWPLRVDERIRIEAGET